ncbi:hypothetical protein [Vibrio sp. MACH09]|uniref:hypothetical protein n=1 Tax=Vibrio sp. MACH09 TaxID=3025122 RepID=UPI00295E58E6|nr:hypothetical protein [Vibrio sp. MACH09]
MTGLNFDAIPELHVPLRFYLTAPLFAILASLLFIDQGSTIWLSRWLPASLAITHLFALGVMAMVMIGSLYQVMPVLCGAPIPTSKWSLLLIHAGLTAGTLLLCAGFLGWISLMASFVVLAMSLGYFIVSILWVLIRNASGQQTRTPILMAVSALALLLVVGLLLLSSYLWGFQPTVGKSLTHLHASLGLFGWVLLLMMAVSFQVIPMFHVTPVFPRLWRVGLTASTVVGLVAMTLATFLAYDLTYFAMFLASIAILYAAVALSRLAQRKRKLPDVVVNYWQSGFACLILASLLVIAMEYASPMWQVKLEVLVALIIGLGFIVGIMQGMLLKIVPFLISLHLQPIAMQNPSAMMLLPDHYRLISRKQCRVQYWLYVLVLASIAVSFFVPSLSFTMGLSLMLNWLVVGLNLLQASKIFFTVRKQMLAL